MQKRFNITGRCFPEQHYMADVSKKMAATLKMVEYGSYFIINRPRQYGKTTTLFWIYKTLKERANYVVFNISFEGVGDVFFSSEKDFCQGFVSLLSRRSKTSGAAYLTDFLEGHIPNIQTMNQLSGFITDLVMKAARRVILTIDEVDKSSDNQLFINFLAMLRDKYLVRDDEPTFHSIVLAGVHDIKSLKLRIRPETQRSYNSPWNIAANFNVKMEFSPEEIEPMLKDYVQETGVTMDIRAISERIFYHTSGYPFLVSRLCMIIDEKILPTKTEQTWTLDDVEQAVKMIVKEKNTNFDSIIKYLDNDPELYQIVKEVAVDSEKVAFNHYNRQINLASTYGFFVDRKGYIEIHNRIYNDVLVSYMYTNLHIYELLKRSDFGGGYVNDDKTLDMEAIMLGFQSFMRKEYNKKERDFLEKNGRLIFLAFVKPIINGVGHDFKEVQISEEKRLDVVLTYYKEKYVVELKLWRGEKLHQKGLLQLTDYLQRLDLNEGYLIIFDHSEIKDWKVEHINFNDKKIMIIWV